MSITSGHVRVMISTGFQEVSDLPVTEVGVTVRVDTGSHRREVRIGLLQPTGHFLARSEHATPEAHHPLQAAVEFHDSLAARGLVQPVRVLGDHTREQPMPPESGRRPVPRARALPVKSC